MAEGGAGGIVFKWTNRNEIMSRHNGTNDKSINVQAHINKVHVNYIATRPRNCY